VKAAERRPPVPSCRGERALLAVAAVVIAASVVVAIAVDEPPARPSESAGAVEGPLPGGIPTVSGTIFGPGTPIAPGYEMAEGSYLVGRAFPGHYPDGPDTWTALLLVTGDPDDVILDYKLQAKADGFDAEGGGSEPRLDRCGGREQDPAVDFCLVQRHRDANADARAAVSMQYVRGEVAGRTTSTMLLQKLSFASLGVQPQQGNRYERLALPDAWSPLPRMAEGITPPTPSGAEPMRVVAGSRVVAPGWLLHTDGCRRHATVIRIEPEADPDQIFEDYLAQFGGNGPEESELPYRATLADGSTVRFEPATSVTVWDRYLTYVREPGGTAWILFEGCG
jgi:hypothetical protein